MQVGQHLNTLSSIIKICNEIPKAELHVHIEGTLEPELMFKIAERNDNKFKYEAVEKVKEKYNFKTLEEFLEIYYTSGSVLQTEQDFKDLVIAYFNKVYIQGVKYAEIFFDPQAHLRRGVDFITILNGLIKGLMCCKETLELDGNFIMCFLRDMPEENALVTLEKFIKIRDENLVENIERVIGIGLDSSELDNPPEKFKNVFKQAKECGLRLCAHCHDEGSIEHIRTALEECHVERIDHGFDIIQDENLLRKCVERNIAFTFCPLSTFKVQRTLDIKIYKLNYLIEQDLLVTVNSDDPAYFGGYIADNYILFAKEFNLSFADIIKLANNSFKASFMNNEMKIKYLKLVECYTNTLH